MWTLVLAGTLVASVSGCHGGDGPPLVCDDPTDSSDCTTGPPPPPDCAYLQVNYPAVDGFSGDAIVQAAQLPGPTCMQSLSSGPISLAPFNVPFVPPSNGTTLFYFNFVSSVTQDAAGYPAVDMQIPSSLIVPGRTFHLAANYYGTVAGWTADAGAFVINGNVLHSGSNRLEDVWELDPGFPFEFAVYSVGP